MKRILIIAFALTALPFLGAPQIVNQSETAKSSPPPFVCQWLPFVCLR